MYCGTDYVSVSSVSSLHFAKKSSGYLLMRMMSG
jgi:hypothetical protein